MKKRGASLEQGAFTHSHEKAFVPILVLTFFLSGAKGAELWEQDNSLNVAATLGYNIKADFSEYGPNRKRDGDPQLGAEASYSRRLFRLGNRARPTAMLGLETSLGITDLAIGGKSHETAEVEPGGSGTIIVIPPPPHGGGPGGPPIIIDDPGPTAGTYAVAAVNRLDGQLYSFKLGPFIELPLSKSSSLTIGGGLAIVGAHTEYSFSQTVTGPDVTQTQSASSSKSDWQAGGYVKGALIVRLVKNWHALAGVEYRNVGNLSQSAGAGRAKLYLSDSVFLSLGIGCSF